MCFSASVSFGASAVLGAIGVISISEVKKVSHIPFAVIPFMFAVQQFSEGMLWVGLSDPAYASWQHFSIYIFLVFAQLIWPTWVPLSMFLLEKDPIRKQILKFLLIIGLSISSYLLYCMFVYNISAEIRSGHIHYVLNFPLALVWISSILYFMPTVISLFISSVKRMWILGMAILFSFLFTKIYFDDYFISIWCFFAALLSFIVLGIVSILNTRERPLDILIASKKV